jgi:tRNA(fMet)-specific endonuclease VapC
MAPRRRQPNAPAVNAAIIDTDVVSMLFKGDSRAQQYRIHLAGRLLGISFMTLAEPERWQLERNWETIRKEELAQHLTKYVVLPVSRELCTKWAEVSWEARRKDRPIQTADAWIAASALYYRVPLITNNAADRSGLPRRRPSGRRAPLIATTTRVSATNALNHSHSVLRATAVESY